MFPLKQSAIQTVVLYASDAAGDAVVGIADGSWTKRISKAGGAFAAMTITLSELEAGFYAVPLSAAHTDTLGVLTLRFSAAGAKQVNLQYRVDARVPDDLAFPAVTGRSLDVDASGRVPVSGFLAGAITAAAFTAGAIDAAAIATDAIGAAEFAAGAATEIAGAVWEELRSAHVVAGSFGGGVASVQGNVTGSVGSVGAGGIVAATFGAGAIDAAAIATDAIGSAELAATAVVEIAGAVWEELRSAHVVAGSFGGGVASVQGNVTGSVGSVTGAVGSVTGAVGSVTGSVGSIAAGGITAASHAAGAIDAAAIATDAIGSSELAASAVVEIAGAVWEELRSAHVVAGSFGGGIASVTGSVGSIATAGITAGSFAAGAIDNAAIATDAIGSAELAATAAVEIAGQVWEELRSGHTTAGSFGQGVASVIAPVTATISAGGITAATFAAGAIDAAAIATDALGSLELAAGAVTEIADAVWNTLRAGHATAGTFGEGTLVEGLNATARAQVNAEVLDVLTVDTFAEPAAVSAATASLKDKIGWLHLLARNRLTQSATLTVVRNSGDTTDVATAVTSDNGTLAVRSGWT